MRVIRWKNAATGVESLNITETGVYFPVGKEDAAFIARYVMASAGQTASVEVVRDSNGSRVGVPGVSVSGTTETISRYKRSLAFGIIVTAISGTLIATLDDQIVRTIWPDNLGRFPAQADLDAFTYGGTGLDGSTASVNGVQYTYGAGGWEATCNNKGRILLLGDSLGQVHLRGGYDKGGSSMSGVSRFTIDQTATPGTSQLRYYAADRSLTWQAPGDTEGQRVVVDYPQPLRLLSGNGKTWFLVTPIPGIMPTVDTVANVTVAYQNATFYGSVPVAGANQGALEPMIRALSKNGIEVVNHSVGGLTVSGLLALANGLVADPSKAYMLAGIDRVVVEIGTNDLLGNVNDSDAWAPATWMSLLGQALSVLRSIAPVIVCACPVPALSTAAKREAAWKYYYRPLRATCNAAGALCIHPWGAAFGATAATPDTGMIPDSAHQSAQLAWRGVPLILDALDHPRLYTYMPFAGDLYNETTNPTGNLLGATTPTGTDGTASTGGSVTALYSGWVVQRTAGTAATITATQEALDGLTVPWQKLAMSGAAAIMEITRCYKVFSFTPPAVDTQLNGQIEMRIPAQSGLRRVGVQIEAQGADGRLVVWENETQTAQYPAMPPQAFDLVVPLESLKVPAGMTGVRVAIYLQTEIGATCSVYFRRLTLAPA